MSKPETRLLALEAAELRVDSSGDSPVVEGYAALYNVRSENLGGFVEYIMPGAFDRALREGHDVRALIDHDASKILGRTKAGTLELSTDSRGLKIRATLPNTSYARDLVESMRRGDVSQMSFGFRPLGDPSTRWEFPKDRSEPAVHRVRDLELLDVSVVTYPAYPQTSAVVRDLEEARAQAEASLEEARQAEAQAEAGRKEAARLDLEATDRLLDSKF